MNISTKLLKAAAGQGGGAGLDVDEVFSTFLYDGTGSAQSINNGIDLSGEGGLVWLKSRTSAGSSNIYGNHRLYDTERGVLKSLLPDQNTDETPLSPGGLTAFNSNGFTLGSNVRGNNSGTDYVSWTFRKEPKFFDIQTYTGDGTNGRQISHNLGHNVGMAIIKKTSASGDWWVWHRSAPNNTMSILNDTNAFTTSAINSEFPAEVFGDGNFDQDPTSTFFEVSSYASNENGVSYVAYLFAHHDGDGDFGPSGDQDIIKCGSYTGNGSDDGPTIDLGFEPQWLLVKSADQANKHWLIADVMRGWKASGEFARLRPHRSDAEDTTNLFRPTATGFKVTATGSDANTSGGSYIYMAIRRGPLAAPTDATKVFAIDTRGASEPAYDSGFPVDFAIVREANSYADWFVGSRLNQARFFYTNKTDAEASASSFVFDYMDGWNSQTGSNSNLYAWMWKRAPSYFDVVAYTGTGSNRTVTHNLGAVPEMMWVKKRSSGDDWFVYFGSLGNTNKLELNSTSASGSAAVGGNQLWNSTTPTSSVFSVSDNPRVNESGETYIAYLFATVAGVSKVGSYDGNGSNQNIDCGFSSGARFILIKSKQSGSFYVFDTVRGIVAGNDSHLKLDSDVAEAYADSIDTYSGGFNVVQNSTTDLNKGPSDESYIFYAIA